MDPSKIAIRTTRGIEFLNTDDILCCIARGRYTRILMRNGKDYLLTRVLKELEESLPCQDFFRTHKSYLINLNHMVQYQKNHERTITMENNIKILLSKRRQKEFHNRLNDMITSI